MDQTKKVKIPKIRKDKFGKYFRQHYLLYLMLLPGVIYFILFKYIPMGGIAIAFQNYSPSLRASG